MLWQSLGSNYVVVREDISRIQAINENFRALGTWEVGSGLLGKDTVCLALLVGDRCRSVVRTVVEFELVYAAVHPSLVVVEYTAIGWIEDN